MKDIHKLIKDGQVIFPATSTDAIIDESTELSLSQLLSQLFPVETVIEVDKPVIEVGQNTPVKFTWKSTQGGRDITNDCKYSFNGSEISGNTVTETIKALVNEEIERGLKITYNGVQIEVKVKVYAASLTYYGAMNSDKEFTSANIQALPSNMLVATKENEVKGINLTSQRFVYAYPSALGELESIKDINGFEYFYNDEDSSFKKTTVAIDGITYNVYYLDVPVTVKSFGFKMS